jgi:error-prone DNA polymerase
MEARTVIQWDKDGLEVVGWAKLDLLGLRQLSAVGDACDFIAAQTGQRPDLSTLPLDDPAVYAMLNRGETIGVFQLESRAQASFGPRFRVKTIGDITIRIALVRPGPVQGNMVEPYLQRCEGQQPVTYLHPKLEPALRETLGVIVFQEDVLKIARDLAGFSAGEGELLRRALGHKRAEQQIETFREKFLRGAQAQGVSPTVAKQVFAQLRAFGGYSFARSHAAAFAVVSYWSAWLRCYHPAAFFAGLLRHQPMGFYAGHVVMADAERVGVQFLPVAIRHSEASACIQDNAIRLGLDCVHGIGAEQIDVILAERGRRPFGTLADFVRRTGLDRRQVHALVLAGGLDDLGERRQLLWDLAEAFRLAKRPPELGVQVPGERAAMLPMDAATRMATAFAYTGYSMEGHITELRRDIFVAAQARPINELSQLRQGQPVKIGGIVVSMQRPGTAHGVCFLALEDPGGLVNVVVFPKVYQAYREAIQHAFVIVEGVVDREHGAISVVARKIIEV